MCRMNPKVDFAFKKLFGSEENKDILMAVINSVLSNAYEMEGRVFTPIANIELRNPYNLADYQTGKLTILDIKAQDEKDIWYDIEMQIGYQDYFAKRAMYYWSKVYTDQLTSKGRYGTLNKVIGISFLDFKYLPGEPHHNIYRLLNSSSHQELEDICELHFIELEKFKLELPQVHTALDRWITFLNHAGEYNSKSIPVELAQDEMVKKAVRKLDVLSMSEEEWEIYKDREKSRMDQLGVLESAMRKAKEEGLAVGLAEGRQEGRQEGRVEGRVEGRAEGELKARQELVLKMLHAGMDIIQIAHVTGLSKECVEKLVLGDAI